MNRADLWNVWAPDDAWWSPWAKPVLFAQLDDPPRVPSAQPDWQSANLEGMPTSADRAAIVVDLDGIESVAYGLALVKRGFRPVPLYNVCCGPLAVVPAERLQAALVSAADDLAALSIPLDAPPAFLLDARRMEDAGRVKPGQFDNRWMTFPQDYPSGELLRARGIDAAAVVQDKSGQPRDDLAHVLLGWQEAGLTISIKGREDAATERVVIARPKGYRWWWYRALGALGLSRNSAGGFGSVVPEPSPSSGGGFRMG